MLVLYRFNILLIKDFYSYDVLLQSIISLIIEGKSKEVSISEPLSNIACVLLDLGNNLSIFCTEKIIYNVL